MARVTTLETGAASGSSGLDSSGSWNVLGHSNGSTAAGLSGPVAQGHLITIEIRDVDLILSEALRMNMHEVPSYYGSRVNNTTVGLRIGSITCAKKSNIPAYNKPITTHCKTGSLSAGLVFGARVKCQDFVARKRDDGIPNEVNIPFCNAKTSITVHQSKSLEDREVGKQLALWWTVLDERLKVLYLEGDDTGTFIVPALDAHSQVIGINDRSNGVKTSVGTCTFWKRTGVCSHWP